MSKRWQEDNRDVFDKALDNPDEYDEAMRQAKKDEESARRKLIKLSHTPEGYEREKDFGLGALGGAAAFLAQRGVRRLIRRGPKELTMIGGITGPATAAIGGGINVEVGKKRRRDEAKQRTRARK